MEAFSGAGELEPALVEAAFASVTSPGRLEVVRRSPTVLLDVAHNPHGAAALVDAVQEAFAFSPLVGVVGMMADKDVEGILRVLEPLLATVVVTQSSSDRSMPAAELAEVATDLFGEDRVVLAPALDDAVATAINLAESAEGYEEALGSGGVLVTGSVVTVGEARVLLGGGAA